MEGHGPDLPGIYERWTEFLEFAATVTSATGPLIETDLGCLTPKPRRGVPVPGAVAGK